MRVTTTYKNNFSEDQESIRASTSELRPKEITKEITKGSTPRWTDDEDNLLLKAIVYLSGDNKLSHFSAGGNNITKIEKIFNRAKEETNLKLNTRTQNSLRQHVLILKKKINNDKYSTTEKTKIIEEIDKLLNDEVIDKSKNAKTIDKNSDNRREDDNEINNEDKPSETSTPIITNENNTNNLDNSNALTSTPSQQNLPANFDFLENLTNLAVIEFDKISENSNDSNKRTFSTINDNTTTTTNDNTTTTTNDNKTTTTKQNKKRKITHNKKDNNWPAQELLNFNKILDENLSRTDSPFWTTNNKVNRKELIPFLMKQMPIENAKYEELKDLAERTDNAYNSKITVYCNEKHKKNDSNKTLNTEPSIINTRNTNKQKKNLEPISYFTSESESEEESEEEWKSISSTEQNQSTDQGSIVFDNESSSDNEISSNNKSKSDDEISSNNKSKSDNEPEYEFSSHSQSDTTNEKTLSDNQNTTFENNLSPDFNQQKEVASSEVIPPNIPNDFDDLLKQLENTFDAQIQTKYSYTKEIDELSKLIVESNKKVEDGDELLKRNKALYESNKITLLELNEKKSKYLSQMQSLIEKIKK